MEAKHPLSSGFILAIGMVVLLGEAASVALLLWYARYNDRCRLKVA